MKTKKEKFIMPSTSSKFIIHKENKLVINTPYPLLLIKTIIISAVILDVIFGINLPVSLTFFISDEILMTPKALNSSKLSCDRIENEVSCSLSGNNLFGNVEKAFNSKHGKLVKVMRKTNNFRGTPYRNDLLILITTTEDIPLYTSGNLVDDQYFQLNKFLENRMQSKVSIQLQRSLELNASTLFENSPYVFITIFCYLLGFIALTAFFLYKLSTNIYILDKDAGMLKILSSYKEKLIREIPLQRIKKIILDKQVYRENIRLNADLFRYTGLGDAWSTYEGTLLFDHSKYPYKHILPNKKYFNYVKITIFTNCIYKIFLYDFDNSFLLSINFTSIGVFNAHSEAHKIANSICIFLQINPYESNKNPP